MNNKSKSAGRPAPDENRIEEILSNIQPVPGNGFHKKMLGSPWQAARRQQGKSTMKTKFAFSVLAMLLVFAATVAFVPPVRAQVSEWFSVTFQDLNGSDSSFGFAGEEPLKYQVLQPGYLPQILSDNTIYAWFSETSEVIYKADDQFLVITQTEAVDGESLPDGEAVTVNGQPAVLNRGLSGTYQQAGPEGINPIGASNDFITFDYTDAAKLTFVIDNTKVKMLSNMDVAELIKIAESLVPAQ